MRRILVGVGVVFLSSAPVLAKTAGNSDSRDQMMDQDLAGTGTARVDRWVFGAAGPDRVRAAAEHCSGTTTASASLHHTGGDIAAAVFSLGWYTPVHVTYACSPAANR
jgi:hypothetical protein